MTKWHGDELPGGLTPDDRMAWPIVGTVVIRKVPDPATGRFRGMSVEFTGDDIPKIILADQLMLLVRDLMTHDDFQDGVPLKATRDEEEGPTDG